MSSVALRIAKIPNFIDFFALEVLLEPAWAVGSEAALLEPFLSIIESYTTCSMLFSLFQMNLQCVIFRWVHHLVATLHPWRFGATLDVAFFPDASGSVWSDKNWSGVDLESDAGQIFSEKLMNIAKFIGIYISPDTLKSYYGMGPDFQKAASLRKWAWSNIFVD